MATDTYDQPGFETTDHDQLLAVGQAAKLIGVSVSTLQRWDRDGHLPALRTPRNQRRYRRSDLLAAIERVA